MKKLLLALLTLSFHQQANAQVTRAQFINNSADQALSAIDIYVNGVIIADNLTFHTASPILNIQALAPINIGVAPANSNNVNDTFYNINTTLLPTDLHTFVANGIESATGYSPATPFTLSLLKTTKDFVTPATNTEVIFVNGITDAPNLDLRTGIRTLAHDVSFGSFSAGYEKLTTANIKVRLTNATGRNTFETYTAPFSALNYDGRGCIVLASGFMDPSVNSNGQPMGLWAVTTSGGPLTQLFPTTAEALARGQLIHNSADTAADTVDVYVDGTKLIDDLRFQTGSPYLDFNAKTPITIAVAPKNSINVGDAFYSMPITMDSAGKYIFVAHGIISDTGYTPKPAFSITTYNQAKEIASNAANTDLVFMHGSTDAPAITTERAGNPLFPSTTYSNFNTGGYQSFATVNSTIRATTTAGIVDYEANFQTLGWQGRSAVLLSSGFVDTSSKNSKGPLMGLYAVSGAGGPFIKLPVTTVGISSIAKQLQFSIWPNPATNELHIAAPATKDITVVVLDLNGKQVLQSNERVINTSRLAAGAYILQVTTANESGYKTFVKQ